MIVDMAVKLLKRRPFISDELAAKLLLRYAEGWLPKSVDPEKVAADSIKKARDYLKASGFRPGEARVPQTPDSA